ncbi:lysophospholipid acyltransferase 5 isoform X1 [Diachasma alloeum]|uniref:lysophospholipid acyltransferase 5 isoform X1 n=2 Tax=Diachasma alloeum TaxID=454923 RepID=UPI0007383834|nr:lysophospholipid acyltransferase 5 isoform X1 [Diachasma alloeum]
MNAETQAGGGVAQLARAMGASEPALRLIISISLGFPLAYLHRRTLYGKTPLHQHVFFILSGVFLGIWNFGWDMSHSAISLCTTYLILLVLGSSKLAVAVTFIFNMSHLLYGYWTTSTEVYDIKWTMPHCVLTLRLIGLSWNYYDGNRDEKYLSGYQKNVSLKQLPSFLECAGFTYFPGAFLVGPQFSMRRYLDYVNGELIESKSTEPEALPDNIVPAIKRTALAFIYLLIYLVGAIYVSDEFLLSDDFGNSNFFKKVFLLGLWARVCLYKYIGCWLLTEGVCTTFALSYNGRDENGQSKWDGCANVDLFTFENATTFNHYIQSFNMNSNQWFAEYIYKRLKYLGSRNASQFFTLLFIAVWHGFHFGYYLTFFNEFIIMHFEKDITPVLRKNDKLQAMVATPHGKVIAWSIQKIYTLIFMGHAFVPFGLLSYSHYMHVYSSVYYFGFLVFCGYPFAAPYVKRIIRGSATRPHSE